MQSQYILLLCAQHLPIGKFSAGIIFYSGLLALLTITLHDFAGTFVLRYDINLSFQNVAANAP